MRKLLPFLLALAGLGAGVGAGFALRPDGEETVVLDPCREPAADEGHHSEGMAPTSSGDDHGGASGAHEYVKLNNQFVVPIVEDAGVAALVILSISLEVQAGTTEAVFAREPKLRDLFLQVLFDHANAGGFRGAFTSSNRMELLRDALLEVARKTLGSNVADVLITDIVRQDS
ncbi:MAG: flagellar basal body-associated FliL family protein [Paracoccaceae bacterium]